jgi:hypothetical protein
MIATILVFMCLFVFVSATSTTDIFDYKIRFAFRICAADRTCSARFHLQYVPTTNPSSSSPPQTPRSALMAMTQQAQQACPSVDLQPLFTQCAAATDIVVPLADEIDAVDLQRFRDLFVAWTHDRKCPFEINLFMLPFNQGNAYLILVVLRTFVITRINEGLTEDLEPFCPPEKECRIHCIVSSDSDTMLYVLGIIGICFGLFIIRTVYANFNSYFDTILIFFRSKYSEYKAPTIFSMSK